MILKLTSCWSKQTRVRVHSFCLASHSESLIQHEVSKARRTISQRCLEETRSFFPYLSCTGDMMPPYTECPNLHRWSRASSGTEQDQMKSKNIDENITEILRKMLLNWSTYLCHVILIGLPTNSLKKGTCKFKLPPLDHFTYMGINYTGSSIKTQVIFSFCFTVKPQFY